MKGYQCHPVTGILAHWVASFFPSVSQKIGKNYWKSWSNFQNYPQYNKIGHFGNWTTTISSILANFLLRMRRNGHNYGTSEMFTGCHIWLQWCLLNLMSETDYATQRKFLERCSAISRQVAQVFRHRRSKGAPGRRKNGRNLQGKVVSSVVL